ncbi:VPEID-CTERM sorting domain-containing protein [Methylomicrobium lacus]|uniref:VPEID-CTERM sorting domain-containing protein n=1 Tax=Methylomicrobium lacus TaxID=136992 RepID=UPI0035A82312
MHPQNHARGHSGSSKGRASYTAPEIDAASGTSAIALLAGVLLLAGERARSKRS